MIWQVQYGYNRRHHTFQIHDQIPSFHRHPFISHSIASTQMESFYQHFLDFDLSLNQRSSLFLESRFGAEISRTLFQQIFKLVKASDPKLFATWTDKLKGFHTKTSKTDPHKMLILALYSHSKHYNYGRVFSIFTSMERQLRYLLFHDTHVELDAANFVPETLYQITQKLRPKLNCPELTRFVKNRDDTYARVAALGLDANPKTFVLKLLNQPERTNLPPQALFLRKLQREILKIKSIFNEVNPHIAVNPKKGWKPETVLCRWIDTLEVALLEILVEHLQTNKLTRHCIPIHDGLLIEKGSKLCLQKISNIVFQETGFRYTYKLKQLKPNCNSLFYLN